MQLAFQGSRTMALVAGAPLAESSHKEIKKMSHFVPITIHRKFDGKNQFQLKTSAISGIGSNFTRPLIFTTQGSSKNTTDFLF
jgi:hypothetical protein